MWRVRALLPAVLALAALPAGALADGWSTTRAMTGQRNSHTATLLANGQVLVAGGKAGTSSAPAVDTSERWDPLSGAWLGSPSFLTARYDHTATLLLDGRALLAGGRQTDGTVFRSASVFDPVTNTWSPAEDMPHGHASQTQATLQDGRVLVIGGHESRDDASADRASDQAELFEPATGRWTSARSTPFLAANATATLLGDGSVLVAGGSTSTVRHAFAYRYLPATDTWSFAGRFTDARSDHMAASLNDGRVLLAGGTTNDGTALKSATLYDPATNGWTEVAPMATARYGATATTLPNGKVLVAGGSPGSGYLDTTELFDPATNTWSPGPPMAARRTNHSATLLADGRVLVAGGTGQEPGGPLVGALTSAEVYTPDGWPFTRGGSGGDEDGGGGGTSGRPGISALTLSAARFRAAGSGPSALAARRRGRAPVGTTISWRAATAATATFAVQRPAAGRRAGGRCVRPTRANRRRARCTRWTTVGSFRHTDTAGPNSLRFTGRIRGHKLAPGRYRLSVTARSGRDRPSAAKTVAFQIVR